MENTFTCTLTTVVNVRLGIILIGEFQLSKMDLLSTISSCATKIISLISMQLIIAEGNKKISLLDKWKKKHNTQ